MRAGLKIVGFAGLVFVLAGCGGSVGSDGANQALTDAKCSGSSCAPEAPAAATPASTVPAVTPTSIPPGQPLVCGGLDATTCPQGYHCVDDPADKCDPATGVAACSGICVLGEELPTCGGAAGTPCPAGSVCADDPTAACSGDPAADCPGVCRPQAAGQCVSDADCPQLKACSVCPDGTVSCPLSHCDNGQCTVDFEPCSEPPMCGGIGGLSCAPGFQCVDDPTDDCVPEKGGADCGGICVPQETPLRCGGILAEQCPAGFECVDDPSDTCDPNNGGADCPGLCKPANTSECRADADCAAPALCNICADGTESCARSECQNGSCTVVIGACTGPGFCGGIAGFPCPPGSTCVDDPKDDCDPTRGGADCGGICVREEKPLSCGGVAGKTCPDGYACVDDASDDCDPANGGADCPGICQPAPGKACSSDADCPQIGAPCQLCADGTAACPRSLCINGQCGAEFATCRGGS